LLGKKPWREDSYGGKKRLIACHTRTVGENLPDVAFRRRFSRERKGRHRQRGGEKRQQYGIIWIDRPVIPEGEKQYSVVVLRPRGK